MNRAVRLSLAGSCGLAAAGVSAGEPALKNWFNDPFFAVAAGMPGCPLPRGPFLTEPEMNVQAHVRAERDTRCWQAGKCDAPAGYANDAQIAEAVRQRFAATQRFAKASLWVTVMHRYVWVEGCAPRGVKSADLERWLAPVPGIRLVIVNLQVGVTGKPPYQVRQSTGG